MCTEIRARSAKVQSLPPEGQRQKNALDLYPEQYGTSGAVRYMIPFRSPMVNPRPGWTGGKFGTLFGSFITGRVIPLSLKSQNRERLLIMVVIREKSMKLSFFQITSKQFLVEDKKRLIFFKWKLACELRWFVLGYKQKTTIINDEQFHHDLTAAPSTSSSLR
jgi:hypothetical protein